MKSKTWIGAFFVMSCELNKPALAMEGVIFAVTRQVIIIAELRKIYREKKAEKTKQTNKHSKNAALIWQRIRWKMERQIILEALSATLNPNPQLRNQAEAQLQGFEAQPGFTVYCLQLAVDQSITPSQRSSAAVFFKNRVTHYWNSESDRGIKADEQEQIKQKLIESLIKVHNDNLVRPQLTTSVRSILNRGFWTLHEPIVQLLTSRAEPSHVATGLLLLFEATRSLRYSSADRTLIDSYMDQTFPILETLAFEVLNNDDYASGNILYLILKIFKYSSLISLPQYFFGTDNKLSTWITIHLASIQRQIPEKVLEVDPADRTLDLRIKCFKWGFANLHKFYQRYGLSTSQSSSPEFIKYFNDTYVPEILKVYFSIVEKWSNGFWLSDSSLYHLISFFEKSFMSTSWELVKSHYEVLLRHLIYPSLCQENLELFEDDPEEYIRRYFDVNRETTTPDVAAVDALFVTVHHRFEVLPVILNLLNEIFNLYSQDPSLSNALKAEGGLRILSSISISLEKENSPVKDQIDQIIDGLVAPHLSSNYEFLRARACETISIFAYEYKDKNVLSKVFEGVYSNFKNTECLPIQIEAADALRVLITDPLVTDAISNDVPIIMQKLLHLSRSYEMDMIGEIMEAFVEIFSTELEPFANDLGNSLCDQFIRTATEFLEMQGRGDTAETDKEYQAVGYLNTMSTMVFSMPGVDLESIFAPAIKFVLNNAALAFLGESMELMESMTIRQKKISPIVWELYHEVLDSFQTYAVEYFELYIPVLENIITYGFKGLNSSSQQVVLLNDVVRQIITSQIDFDNEGAFELVEYMTLTLREYNSSFESILELFQKESTKPYSFIKVLLASVYVDPERTLQLLESKNETVRLFEVWFNLSASLGTVYGSKLQALALLSILSLPQIPTSLEGFIPQLSNKLASSIQRILPGAVEKKQGASNVDKKTISLEHEGAEDEDEDEDAFKDTPLTDINAFGEFKSRLTYIEGTYPDRYRVIISSLSPEGLDAIKFILSLQ